MVRTRHIDWGLASFRAVFGVLAAVTVLVLVFPTAVILILSFTGEDSLHFPPASYSFRSYLALVDAREIQDAALVSLKVAAIAVSVSVLLGVAAAGGHIAQPGGVGTGAGHVVHVAADLAGAGRSASPR